MKPLKIIAVFVLGVVLGTSSVNAQQNNVQQNRGESQLRLQNLTQEQQQLFQEQQALIKQNREILKATLSAEQLAILENTELTKQERHQALVATFTEAQQALMATNRNRVREIKEQFRNTITTEQRQQIRMQLREHKGTENGDELRKNIREQRKTNNNNGSGNGSGGGNRKGNG